MKSLAPHRMSVAVAILIFWYLSVGESSAPTTQVLLDRLLTEASWVVVDRHDVSGATNADPFLMSATDRKELLGKLQVLRSCNQMPLSERFMVTGECNSSIFKLTLPGGTGLGLFSVRELVTSLSGTLEVYSQLGKGAEFEIVLDAVAVAASAPAKDLVGLQVLCVDDDELSYRMLGLTLEKMGCKPILSNCPEEALEYLRTEHLRTGQFDVLVTDFSMKPTNGIELAECARGISPDLHIVLATGYRDILEEKGRMFTGLFADVLTKPVDAGDLSRAILGLQTTGD